MTPSEIEGTTSFPAKWELMPSLRRVVSGLIVNQIRVKIRYAGGWSESGYISRTAGKVKAPIVVYNAASMGGTVIGHHVLSIVESKKPHTLFWSLERDEPVAFVHFS